MSEVLHAGLIARRRGGVWRGVLIEGASGAGKSDLALRALAEGWRLVADDRVVVWRSGGRVYGRAPERLRGLVEGRGAGMLAAAIVPAAEIVLAVVQAASPERMPERATRTVAGVAVRSLALNLLEGSALAKLTLTFRGDAASQLGA